MDDLKFEVKEEIVKILSRMYLDKGNQFPNWSEDEEIVIDADEFKHKVLIDVKIYFYASHALSDYKKLKKVILAHFPLGNLWVFFLCSLAHISCPETPKTLVS